MIFCDSKARRHGSLLLEITSSTVLLGAVLILIARVAVAINTQSHLAEQRELASQALQNTMEELALLSPVERQAKGEAPLSVSEEVVRRLASAELLATIAADKPLGEPPAQRVTLRLSWQPTPDAEKTSLALTAFFHEDQRDTQ